ncbi:MAG: FAD-dependent oxidoreductase [Chloroflexi bacterium]|nr:FAD-dependent oxidoreductase [Chloroflexota bacterium]
MITNTDPLNVVQATPSNYTVRVLESRPLTPTSHLLRLEKPAGYDFRVSQATRLFLNTPSGIERHTLSMSSSPTRDYLEFAARQTNSSWKQTFFALALGDPINIQGPVGKFILNQDYPGVLIAGGIGITPFKSMIEYATEMRLPIDFTLLYSSRTPDEIAFKAELDALASLNPHLKIIYTITRKTHLPDWHGRIGRIDQELLRQVSQTKPEACYYICGTPSLIADSIQMLNSVGVTLDRIMLETFKGYALHADNFR